METSRNSTTEYSHLNLAAFVINAHLHCKEGHPGYLLYSMGFQLLHVFKLSSVLFLLLSLLPLITYFIMEGIYFFMKLETLTKLNIYI